MKTMKTASRNGDIMGTREAWSTAFLDYAYFVSLSLRAGYKHFFADCNPSGIGTLRVVGVDKAALISEHGIGTFMGHMGRATRHPTRHEPDIKRNVYDSEMTHFGEGNR